MPDNNDHFGSIAENTFTASFVCPTPSVIGIAAFSTGDWTHAPAGCLGAQPLKRGKYTPSLGTAKIASRDDFGISGEDQVSARLHAPKLKGIDRVWPRKYDEF